MFSDRIVFRNVRRITLYLESVRRPARVNFPSRFRDNFFPNSTFSVRFAGSHRSRATSRHTGPDQRADGRREAESSDALGIRRRLYDEERPRGLVRHGKIRVLRVLQV